MSCIQYPAINLTFTDGTDLYTVAFDKFTSEPRQYVTSGELNFSASGSAVQNGSSRANRMTWAISAFADRDTIFDLDEMYRKWDAYRATGAAAVIGVTDQTRVRDPINAPITAAAVFTAPPVFEPRNAGLELCSFGLTEI